MNKEMASKLKDHYSKFSHLREIKIVKMTINREEYYGVSYLMTRKRIPQERMVTEGWAKEGEEYKEERFCLLGEMPFAMKMQRLDGEWKNVLKFENDDRDWYCCCYYEGGEISEYHPFGNEFHITPWDHNPKWMGRIDQHLTVKCGKLLASFHLI